MTDPYRLDGTALVPDYAASRAYAAAVEARERASADRRPIIVALASSIMAKFRKMA